VSYTKAQKSRIVFLANKYDVYLVEDDYIADFETDLMAGPLYFYDINQRVIYLKSFSNIMFPGLRVGFAVLPEIICSQFAEYKRLSLNKLFRVRNSCKFKEIWLFFLQWN
jgi:DNA-binding transcriptional MocR family regulator